MSSFQFWYGVLSFTGYSYYSALSCGLDNHWKMSYHSDVQF